MLQHYWTFTLRNLNRNKVYAAINITGLAIGLSACILIFLFVQYEFSYDAHYTDSDRVYRVVTDADLNGQHVRVAASPGPMAENLKATYPEVESATRILKAGKQALRSDVKALYIENTFYADSNLFEVLDFRFIAGNPRTALKRPDAIVLTENVAVRFFGSPEMAMGKLLKSVATSLQVTGVIATDEATHIQPEVFIPMHAGAGEYIYFLNNWENISAYTYLKLYNPEQAGTLQDRMPEFYETTIKDRLSGSGATGMSFHLQRITDTYFDNVRGYPVSDVGNAAYSRLFAVVAIFILLIASVNYINLATARAARRSREVGIRKVAGASRRQLIFQFISESVFLTLAATLLALVLVELTLPLFNAVTEQNIDTVFILNPGVLAVLAILILFVGVVAGSYPAFYLSAYQPTAVLKVNQLPSGGNALLRKALVVVQFTISLTLIMGTAIVYCQMNYLKSRDLGFNKEQVMAVQIPAIGWVKQKQNLALIKKKLLTLPQVMYTSSAQSIPGQGTDLFPFLVDINHKTTTKALNNVRVGYNYTNTMGIDLVAGRDFSESIGSDRHQAYIINETAAREFGWDPNAAVGQRLRGSWADSTNGKVIGVVKDFNYKSLHSKIEPLILMPDPDFGTLLIRLNAGADLPSTMAQIEKVWQQYFPEYPLDYRFLDASFLQQYRAEEKMLTIFGYFAGLTILIACMGLFGLAAYTAEQRTREIGIRKVLGSSVSNIVMLLSRDFALLVLIAIVLAIPVAWYGMHLWLQDYAYRTILSWWVFAVPAISAMAIALLTVSFHALKAALINPINAIRT